MTTASDVPQPGEAARAEPTEVISEGVVERTCKLLCFAALIVMLVVIGVDIFTRSFLRFSFEVSDELGGYMLALITFVSLSVCQVHGSFHHVQFVQARLSPRGRALSRVIFDLLSLAFCVLLCWQLARFELSSWGFEDRAPTYLATPLWLPRVVLVLGMAAMCFSVLRTLIAHLRQWLRLGAATGAANEP